MNLGKSAASFSESDSDKFLLFFLFKDATSGFLFSLALCSTTHHRVRLEKGMNQGGNPFTLAEMGYTISILISRVKFSAFAKFLF